MMRTLTKLLGIAAAVAIANCGWASGEVVFDDDLYADALEFYDENGEVCIPDMETFVGSGDQGGDTAQGVPTTNPDEDRRGGEDDRYGGGAGAGGETQGNLESGTQGADATQTSEGDGTGMGAGCDAYGCCAGGDMDRERDRTRCRCRLRVRGEEQYVLPECCELEPEAEEPGETDDDQPPPPQAEEDPPADDDETPPVEEEEEPAEEEPPVEDPV